jgi:hypothetical protein
VVVQNTAKRANTWLSLLRAVATPVVATLCVVTSKSSLYEMSLLQLSLLLLSLLRLSLLRVSLLQNRHCTRCRYCCCRYSSYSSRCYSGCRYFKIVVVPDVVTPRCCHSSRRYSLVVATPVATTLWFPLLLPLLLWLQLLIYTPANMDTDISAATTSDVAARFDVVIFRDCRRRYSCDDASP